MARFKASIQSYEQARDFLGNRQERKLAHNTTVRMSFAVAEAVEVVLHRTPVVTFYADGRVRLDSGGYRTRTTADRIRQLLPPGYDLRQRDFGWFLARTGQPSIVFTDGMIL